MILPSLMRPYPGPRRPFAGRRQPVHSQQTPEVSTFNQNLLARVFCFTASPALSGTNMLFHLASSRSNVAQVDIATRPASSEVRAHSNTANRDPSGRPRACACSEHRYRASRLPREPTNAMPERGERQLIIVKCSCFGNFAQSFGPYCRPHHGGLELALRGLALQSSSPEAAEMARRRYILTIEAPRLRSLPWALSRLSRSAPPLRSTRGSRRGPRRSSTKWRGFIDVSIPNVQTVCRRADTP